jgi:hypothetical protein
MQKQIFKNDYDEIKSNVAQEIEEEINKIIVGKKNNLQKKLSNISDEKIIKNYYNFTELLNKDMSFLKISDNYKNNLNILSKKIDGEI